MKQINVKALTSKRKFWDSLSMRTPFLCKSTAFISIYFILDREISVIERLTTFSYKCCPTLFLQLYG